MYEYFIVRNQVNKSAFDIAKVHFERNHFEILNENPLQYEEACDKLEQVKTTEQQTTE